jgi:predicted TPR repeat methyltransferase
MSAERENPAEAAREVEITSAEQAIEIAVSLQRQGKLDKAEEIYRQVLAVEPRNPDALHFLGILLHTQGDATAAALLLHRALDQAPKNAGLWNNLGNVMLESREPESALKAYLRATELAADFAAPWNNLGILYRARGANAEAEAAYRRALEIEPRFTAAWQNFSTFLLGVRRFDEAIECGLRAMTLAPHDLSLLHHIAVAHLALKEVDKATAIYRSWLEKEPDNPVPRHLLAACEGADVPSRASDAFIERTFDRFASTFDAKLEQLGYRAPALVGAAVKEVCGAGASGLRILDAGCGTGLCATEVRSLAAFLAGVDLSAGMLEQAKRAGKYDRLERHELTAYLIANPAAFDVVLSADTLCYFGSLEDFAAACLATLLPGGLLVFTVEAMPNEERGAFRLQPNGRYVHAGGYVDRVLGEAGFTVERRSAVDLRMELGKPVAGWLVTARKERAA